ncbi:hypothetical protein ACVPOW_13305 [Staphylococcus aureus]
MYTKATNHFRDIDRALVWGFIWKLGPFQLWDAMGYERVKTRMEDELESYHNGLVI